MQKDKKDSKKNIVNVDKTSGSLAYNRLDLQISQTLHMAIEFFDSLDYLLVLDYYDDITLFDNDENPEFVSYYQVKTNWIVDIFLDNFFQVIFPILYRCLITK